MSVLTLIVTEEESVPLARWAYHFAHTRGESLTVILGSSKRLSTSPLTIEHGEAIPEGEPLLESVRDALRPLEAAYETNGLPSVTLKCFPPTGLRTTVLDEIKDSDVKLFVLGKHSSSRASNVQSAFAGDLFERVSCETILIRPGGSDGIEAKNILVPVSEGPHAVRALKLAAGIVKHQSGILFPINVEPDADEVSEEVGDHILDRALRRAGVESEERVNKRVILADDVSVGINRALEENADINLVLMGASGRGTIRRILFGTVPERLIESERGMAVAIYRSAVPISQRFRKGVESWLDLAVPQLSRDERVSLFENIQTSSQWNFDFMALIGLSTAIAALGLIQDSTAVVIGAMLVAPLMTPLLGAGLGLVQGNLPLMLAAGRAIIFGFIMAVGISFILGAIIPVTYLNSELVARGGPTLLDMGVGFLSGMAAAYCIARSGLSAALPGVAIAAALVPPIATVGISFSIGEAENAQGAAMLFGANVVSIILGASVSFYGGGVRGNRDYTRARRWTRRVIVGLILSAVVLCFPLGSVLLSKVTELRAIDAGMPQALREQLELYTREMLKGEMVSAVRRERKGRTVVEVVVRASQGVVPSVAEEISRMAQRHIQQPVHVRVRTELVVEGMASRVAELKNRR